MARGVNKAILVGNLGRDPEVRYAPNGSAVANVTIATSEQWKDKQTGEAQERTEWHRVVFFGRLAEIVAEYLKKGQQVYVEGKIQTRKWQDQSGQDRYTTEIVGNDMQMLGGRSAGAGDYNQDMGQSRSQPQPAGSAAPAATSGGQAATPAQGGGAFDDFDDDIPF